jgi:hypothetical protein
MSVLLELLNTSVLVGALHTLAAPNLAALATLSGIDILNQSENDVDDYRNKQRRKGGSFFLGMQWGLGNTFGILFVGAIVVILQTGDPRGDWEWMDDWLRIVMQAFVGVFLLILGIYGLVKALRNRELNTLDLQFKKSVADAESNYSVGIGSAITEIVVNHVDLEEFSEGSAKSARRNPVIMRRASTIGEDSIVQKMTTCLRDDVRNGDALEETLGLSEYEITKWRAAKNVSSSIAMYADDDYSTSSKSLANTNLSSSFTTVKSEWADMLKEGYLDGTPDEEEDVEVVKTKDANSIRTGSDTSSRQSSKFLLRKMSKCGNCLYCTPGLLAFFAGMVYGLSGPGKSNYFIESRC